jgi:hypothetical protein
MLFMVIEHFHGGDARPIYRRFRDSGRLMPDGIGYVASWVDAGLTRCFQVMACEDEALLAQWTAQWSDIVDFEIVPVMTSAQAREKIEPLL